MIRFFAFAMMLAAGNAALAQNCGERHQHERFPNPAVRTFMPPNNLARFDRTERVGQITQEQFNQIIDGVVKHWEPIAKANGVELKVAKLWDNPGVNAAACQVGRAWALDMYGGFARRPEVTPDAFALVVCHELGHHFGGYAFYGNGNWAASEGQSDYWATNVCAKVVWAQEFRGNENFRRIRNIPPTVQQSCGKAYPQNTNAQGWCVRAAAAGQSLANLLAALGQEKQPQFNTPDPKQVPQTDPSHPAAQCRLDTYFAGALCNKKFDLNVIPAKNHPRGQLSLEAEMESMKYTCFESEGLKEAARPRCWFKPLADKASFRRP